MKLFKTKLIVLILSIALLQGCDKDKDLDNSIPETSIIGNWGRTIGDIYIILIFKEDGILGFENDGDVVDDIGVYSLADNQIIFNDSNCGVDIDGSYTYEIDGDTLTFVLITDSCNSRTATLTGGVWIKQ